jgi:hypothetical protein
VDPVVDVEAVAAVAVVEAAAAVVAAAAAAAVVTRLATTAAKLATLPAIALANDWRVKTDRSSTRRGRSTVVASIVARWDTSVPSAPRKLETRLATTAETRATSLVIAPTRVSLPPTPRSRYYVLVTWDLLLHSFLCCTLTSTGYYPRKTRREYQFNNLSVSV